MSVKEFTAGHLLNEAPSLIFTSSLAIGYLLWFGSHIYKTIPTNVGGGKPISVNVIFEDDIKQILTQPDTIRIDSILKTDSIKSTELKQERTKNKIFTLQLVAVIDDSYYFSEELDSGTHNFSVNKSFVKILFYKSNEDVRRRITSGLHVRFRASGSI